MIGTSRGKVSTPSLVIGVAGAMSMAAREDVSLSSQADTEAADTARENLELANAPARELDERTGDSRGLGAKDRPCARAQPSTCDPIAAACLRRSKGERYRFAGC